MINHPRATVKPAISYEDVYKRLWENRDFELERFWHRAVFVGTFLVLTFAGYGSLWLKALESPEITVHWTSFHFAAIGLSCLGITLSALWILMAKASKAWYEWQEAAITTFVMYLTPRSVYPNNHVRQSAAFAIGWIPDFNAEWEKNVHLNESFFSTSPGPFSVSRLTIIMGQLALVFWFVISVFHLIAMFYDRQYVLTALQEMMPYIGLSLFLITIAFIFLLLRWITASSVLKQKQR